ncbi:unnamed protein product [Miscanthus lutarioriparius]|uniref:Uncharacterized protein n=1 Tax=Miscanthus lutarioriparius TaxID=422564 RepID=A0A811QCR3_9POAL|nr:unnamed protein product [Miscanthus lutarioriparius]
MAAPASKLGTAALLLCFLVASLLLASSFVAAATGAGRKMKQTAMVASALHGYPGTNLPPGSYGSYPTAP